MATDYISRSNTKEILVALLIESALNNVGFHTDASNVFEDIARNRLDTWLNLVPKKDAVEVVRCRDCKYLSHFTDGHNECRLLADLRPVPCTYLTMKDTDFCSYGERRTEDG